MASRCLPLLLPLIVLATARADDWPQFRGPERTGVSREKGLLQEWPEKGPKLLWTYRDGGMGFSCPAIVGDRMYTMGGWDDGEYVLCVDIKTRKELWKVKVGKLFSHGNWGDGPRSTPTVDGGHLFALGSYGDLVCLTTEGKEVWRKSFPDDFGGEMMSEWGYSEGPLVDGDLLIVTPGSAKGTLAALDKKTGKTFWQSAGLGNKAPYSSIMISHGGGVKQYVQTSYIDEDKGGFVSGVDARTGKPLWTENIFKQHSYAIAPTPIIDKDKVYITSGYGGGCHLYELSKAEGGVAAKDLYTEKIRGTTKNTHGGVVLVGGHIYGHSEGLGWVCQELKSGKIKWSDRVSLTGRSGSIVAADNRLYLLNDDGETVLLEPSVKEWSETGRFKLPETSKLRDERKTLAAAAVWTNPVIAEGRLYLRDQELIFCFDIKK